MSCHLNHTVDRILWCKMECILVLYETKIYCDVAVYAQYRDREKQPYMNGLACTILPYFRVI